MTTKKLQIPKMSKAEMGTFVLEYCAGRIHTSQNVPTNILGSVFMPLALGALNEIPKKELAKIGVIWASTVQDRTVRGAVNGFPLFASCRIMTKKDWARAVVLIKKEYARQDKIRVGEAA